MLISLNKRIFNFTLDTTDKIVQPILRDKKYLKLNAFQMNTFLSIQKIVEAQTSKVLKGMNIPTQKQLKTLYQTIYELEHKQVQLEKSIEILEEKLAKKYPPTPRKRASSLKKKPEIHV